MKFTCTVDIDLPREHVIKTFNNPHNMRHWQDGFVSFEHLSEGDPKPGSKAKIVYNNNGKEMVLIESLEVYDLPREMTAVYEHEMMDNRMQNLFQEIHANQTRWTANIHYFRMKGFMKIVAWLFPSMFKKQVQKWMDQFKVFAEKQ